LILPKWVLGELIVDLSEFLGREQTDVLDFMEKETYIDKYFDECFNGAFITEENIKCLPAWIQESQYYVFDLTRWHLARPKYFRRRYKKTKRALDWTVLDFGSGIGTHGLIYALKGWKVTLCDINEPCLNFSKKRFEKRGLNASFKKGIDETYYFDEVLLIDTIGHLEKPEKTLKNIAKSMRRGALFEITWDLFDVPVRSHLWSLEDKSYFEDILIENDLTPVDLKGDFWRKTT